MKKIILILMIIICEIKMANCQWIISASSIDSTGTINEYATREFTDQYYERLACTLLENVDKDSFNFRYYLRLDQTDLIYFTKSNNKGIIITTGFYRQVYVENQPHDKALLIEIPLCWQKDLVWSYFDNDGILLRQEFFNKGNLITPKIFKAK